MVGVGSLASFVEVSFLVAHEIGAAFLDSYLEVDCALDACYQASFEAFHLRIVDRPDWRH